MYLVELQMGLFHGYHAAFSVRGLRERHMGSDSLNDGMERQQVGFVARGGVVGKDEVQPGLVESLSLLQGGSAQ